MVVIVLVSLLFSASSCVRHVEHSDEDTQMLRMRVEEQLWEFEESSFLFEKSWGYDRNAFPRFAYSARLQVECSDEFRISYRTRDENGSWGRYYFDGILFVQDRSPRLERARYRAYADVLELDFFYEKSALLWNILGLIESEHLTSARVFSRYFDDQFADVTIRYTFDTGSINNANIFERQYSEISMSIYLNPYMYDVVSFNAVFVDARNQERVEYRLVPGYRSMDMVLDFPPESSWDQFSWHEDFRTLQNIMYGF